MTEPRFRSRTHRRVTKILPSGKQVIHHERRNPSIPKCAICKKELKGIKPSLDYVKRTVGKSKKRTERAYGGFLCSSCSRKKIKDEARA
jgi:large subunit ribosomal protein L34e